MDAQAHLLSLGWAGPGHALDARPYKQKGHRGLAYDPKAVANVSAGNGLIKPLLISQRQGRLGVGKKAHEPQSGNEWWLKGFENALGNIGKSESERSSGTSTPVLADYGAHKHSGLYNFFVKGQLMEGTIGLNGETPPNSSNHSKKRKSEAVESDFAVEAAHRSKKQRAAEDFAQVAEYIAVRDRREVRRQREKKPSAVEEFQQVSEYLELREGRKSKKRKSEAKSTAAPDQIQQHSETKEERRERRRKRREEREQLRSEAVAKHDMLEHVECRTADLDDATAKAARKAERRRQREKEAAKPEFR